VIRVPQIRVTRASVSLMAGVVIFLLIMILGVPIAVMFGGAIWSAVFGVFTENNVDAQAEGTPHSLDA